jgi:hypothetical protein
LNTAHRTRVYLHERAKSPEPLETLSGLNRPSGHDIGMEAPRTTGEIDSFAGDNENDEMTGPWFLILELFRLARPLRYLKVMNPQRLLKLRTLLLFLK